LIVNLGYKYKLVTNKKQKILLFNHLFAHNQAWNILLNESHKQYEQNKARIKNNESPVYLKNTEQDKIIKDILHGRGLVFNTKVVQQTRVNFNKSFLATIKNLSSPETGMLQFKKSTNFNHQSFETTKEQYKIKDLNKDLNKKKKYRILRLFRQDFKIRWTRDFPANSEVKSVTISFLNGDFYVSFNVSYENNLNDFYPDVRPEETNKVGLDINISSIDIGNKDFHKAFNISNIKLNNLVEKNKRKIQRLQRKQSRRVLKKKKGDQLGKNFKKTQYKINKIHTKNHNIKVFQLHKLVNEILLFLKENNLNHIIMEKLNVKEMTKNGKINKVIGKKNSITMKRNILQISFHMLKEIITYKSAN
jgi:putative transposase